MADVESEIERTRANFLELKIKDHYDTFIRHLSTQLGDYKQDNIDNSSDENSDEE